MQNVKNTASAAMRLPVCAPAGAHDAGDPRPS